MYSLSWHPGILLPGRCNLLRQKQQRYRRNVPLHQHRLLTTSAFSSLFDLFVQKTDNEKAETLSPEIRWDWISKIWAKKHDYDYTAKVIKDKVMIVQLNKGDNTFYEEQVTKLANDLETARREGYVVLLFMHEPLVTGNAGDTAVTPILTGDCTTYNFYNNKEWSNVYPEKNTATRKMFELITTNADVIQGVFNGHIHTSFYTEIQAKTPNGIPKAIPQYTVHSSAFNSGYAMKIKVKY